MVQKIQEIHPDYYSVKKVSNTSLGHLKKSPAHFKAFIDGELEKDTPALSFGRLFHEATLEPHIYGNTTFIKQDGRTKKGKQYNGVCVGAGLKPVSTDDSSLIEKMSSMLLNNRWFKLAHQASVKETDLYFEVREGIECKARLDMIFKRKAVIDLKTAVSANPKDFIKKAFYTYDYDRQAAWYLDAAIKCGLVDEDAKFYFVVIEKEPPFAYSIIEVKPSMIESGRQKYNKLLDTYEKTVARNYYPSFGLHQWGEEKEEEFEATPVDLAQLDSGGILEAFGFSQQQALPKPKYRKVDGEWKLLA